MREKKSLTMFLLYTEINPSSSDNVNDGNKLSKWGVIFVFFFSLSVRGASTREIYCSKLGLVIYFYCF